LRRRLSTGPLVTRLGLSPTAIAGLVAQHEGGQDLGRKLFALLTLDHWAARFAN
jgi:hypothetical protein